MKKQYETPKTIIVSFSATDIMSTSAHDTYDVWDADKEWE